MGMGKMGMMGMMGMGMGEMGMMGMMGMGMGDEAPAPPPVADEAEAVGDPHMTLTSGEKEDLCCEGGECKPCPVSLLQDDADYYSYYYSPMLQFDDDGPEEAEAAIGEIDNEVKEILADVRALGMGMGKMGMMGMGKMGMMGMGQMGMMGMMGMGMGDEDVADEAAAVGDPHMTLTSGEKEDLCCEDGVCNPCPVSLLQNDVSAEYYSYYYSSLLQEDELVSADYYSYYYSSLLQEDELSMGMGMMGMGMMGMGMMGM